MLRSYGEFCEPALVLDRRTERSRLCGRLRAILAVLALLAFVTDFVTPTTPTPIAVGVGKHVAQPFLAIISAVVAAARWVLIAYFFSVLVRVASTFDSDLLDLTCTRRC